MSQQTIPSPPPSELPRVGVFFFYMCLVFPKKMFSKEGLNKWGKVNEEGIERCGQRRGWNGGKRCG